MKWNNFFLIRSFLTFFNIHDKDDKDKESKIVKKCLRWINLFVVSKDKCNNGIKRENSTGNLSIINKKFLNISWTGSGCPIGKWNFEKHNCYYYKQFLYRMSISIFTMLLLIYVLLKIKRQSQLRMDTHANSMIKLRLEGDKNAHWKCQKIVRNKIKMINNQKTKGM